MIFLRALPPPPNLGGVNAQRDNDTSSIPLTELTYIVRNAEAGHHVLFEESLIRRAFTTPVPERDTEEMVDVLDAAFRGLLAQPSVGMKRDFVNTLPEPIQNVVIRLYFRFIEQVQLARGATLH